MDADSTLVLWVVVLVRFGVPLLIPRFPLPAILACLVIDAVDQTVFQWFGSEPARYQSYDKAMDIYYLSVAYISTLRNWTNRTALGIGRFLFFLRLVGVLAFELTQWRPLLLILPNVFEYFFIAYESLRSRWDPARRTTRFWVWAAVLIWLVVKLPQEWWIHVAQLDLTDAISEELWLGPAIAVLLTVGIRAYGRAVRPRLGVPDWPRRMLADPLPPEIDEAHERAAWLGRHGAVRSWDTLEKVVLVGLVTVIFGELMPQVSASRLELFTGMAMLVVINVAWSLLLARRAVSRESVWTAGGLRFAFNVGIAAAYEVSIGRSEDFHPGAALLSLGLLTLLLVLHDRYRPVAGVRFSSPVAGPVTGDAPAGARRSPPGVPPR